MKIDCSKILGKDDLLALIGMLFIAAYFAVSVLLAIHYDAYWSGFFSATIIWKWNDWIYKPIDRVLDKLWQ